MPEKRMVSSEENSSTVPVIMAKLIADFPIKIAINSIFDIIAFGFV